MRSATARASNQGEFTPCDRNETIMNEQYGR